MQLSAVANAGAVEVLFAVVDKVDVECHVVKVVDLKFDVIQVLDVEFHVVKVLSEVVSTGTNSEQHTSSTSPSI